MRLYLVQHGEDLPEAVSPERALTERGRAEVEQIASLLERSGVRVTKVCHSGKTRARQTAECFAAHLAPCTTPETLTGLDPNVAVEPLAEQIRTWRDGAVGRPPAIHEPARGMADCRSFRSTGSLLQAWECGLPRA